MRFTRCNVQRCVCDVCVSFVSRVCVEWRVSAKVLCKCVLLFNSCVVRVRFTRGDGRDFPASAELFLKCIPPS